MELKEKTDFFNAIKQLIEKELDFHFSFKETEDKDLKDDFNSFLINSTEKIVDKYCGICYHIDRFHTKSEKKANLPSNKKIKIKNEKIKRSDLLW